MRSYGMPLVGMLLSATAVLAGSVQVTDAAGHMANNQISFTNGTTLTISWTGTAPYNPVISNIVLLSCSIFKTQGAAGCTTSTPGAGTNSPTSTASTLFSSLECSFPDTAAGAGVSSSCTYTNTTDPASGTASFVFSLDVLGSASQNSGFQVQVNHYSGVPGSTLILSDYSAWFNFISTSVSSTIAPASSATSGTSGTSASPTGGISAPPSPLAVASTANTGLSTGAKVGIAVGIVAVVLIALIVGALLFRRHRRNVQNRPSAMTYSRDLPSQHELQQEKEANIIHSSGIAGAGVMGANGHNGRESTYEPVERDGPYDNEAAYSENGINGNGVTGTGHEAVGTGAAVTGAGAGTATAVAHPGRETPGGTVMSADERQRWDDEEARLDEAIAEAERRR